MAKSVFRRAEDALVSDLREAVKEIQEILWLERAVRRDRGDRWNPDKEWDVETIERVADVMNKYGFRPDEVTDA